MRLARRHALSHVAQFTEEFACKVARSIPLLQVLPPVLFPLDLPLVGAYLDAAHDQALEIPENMSW